MQWHSLRSGPHSGTLPGQNKLPTSEVPWTYCDSMIQSLNCGGKYMNVVKACLAILAGFILGAALYRPRSAKAGGGAVYVRAAPVGASTVVSGSNVVGFSCTGSGNSAECYVATQ
jgi:hypothetical protein